MRVAGIIAEYDPIHNGHVHHIKRTREVSRADFVVVVMSGNFTQRGRPAILNKWIRSRMAVECGADLVIELPFCFATASAENFARGGVGILGGLGVVDTISFGVETGIDMQSKGESLAIQDEYEEAARLDDLIFIANFLKEEQPEYKAALKKHLRIGMSFPAARELAVNECLGLDMGRLLKSPNNILAIEYLKQVVSMTPIAIKRQGAHDSDEMPGIDDDSHVGEIFASASAIRRAAKEGDMDEIIPFVPGNSYSHLIAYSKAFTFVTEKYFDILRTMILSKSEAELESVAGVVEGMENKIKKELRRYADYDSYADALKSKRFTRTAIDRMLLHILLGLSRYDMPGKAEYARVLAMNERGIKILREAKDAASIRIITNINKSDIENGILPDAIKYDIAASDFYNIITGSDLYQNSDLVKSPYIESDQVRL